MDVRNFISILQDNFPTMRPPTNNACDNLSIFFKAEGNERKYSKHGKMVQKGQTVRQTKDVELTSPDVSVSQGASSIHLTRNTSFSCRRVLRITNALPK